MRKSIARLLVFHTKRFMPGRIGKAVRRQGRKVLFGKKQPPSTIIGL